MGITIDFTGVSVGGGEALPAGEYEATVKSIEFKPPGPSGFPYLAFIYTAKGDGRTRDVYANYSLSPQSKWRLRKDLTTLGFEVPEGEFDLEPDDVKDAPCRVVLATKPSYKDPDRLDNDLIEVRPSLNWG